MAVDYRLDLRTTAGVKVAEVSDFIGTLTYTKPVNKVGLCQFALPADHAAVQYLSTNAQVGVWRRDRTNGVAWRQEFDGLVRTRQYEFLGEGPETFTVWVSSAETMLAQQPVAWAAGTANRSAFTTAKAETICKTLVSYNVGTAATVANGRLAEGTIAGISVQADGGGGNTLDVNCFGKNLLATLQDLARIGGGDWALVTTGGGAWEFRWYAGQLGTDRSATVKFSLPLGNMANPTYTDARTDERTVAIVGGQGEGAARAFVVRTGTDYSATNRMAVFVDARSQTTTAGLNAAGDAALDKARARPKLTFDLVQTPALVWGRDFFVGDKVSAMYRGYTGTVKVAGVTVSFDKDGNETLAYALEEV